MSSLGTTIGSGPSVPSAPIKATRATSPSTTSAWHLEPHDAVPLTKRQQVLIEPMGDGHLNTLFAFNPIGTRYLPTDPKVFGPPCRTSPSEHFSTQHCNQPAIALHWIRRQLLPQHELSITEMPKQQTTPEFEEREDWLSLRWWLQASPSEAVRRLKIIALAFGVTTVFAVVNILYAFVS